MKWFKNIFNSKTKLQKLVEQNQKLGRKSDALRQKRIKINEQIRKELGE